MRPGTDFNERKTPDDFDTGQTLQKAQDIHAKTRHKSRRDFFEQKRQPTEPQADMGRHESTLPACRCSGQKSFSAQSQTSFCEEFLQPVQRYSMPGRCYGTQQYRNDTYLSDFYRSRVCKKNSTASTRALDKISILSLTYYIELLNPIRYSGILPWQYIFYKTNPKKV